MTPSAPVPSARPRASAPVDRPAPADAGGQGRDGGASLFEVHLDNFEGPFDVLLALIAKHKLDVTEVALSQVTVEFIDYIRGGAEWDLGIATEFLVVASTLLDLKAARLLPAADIDDEEDLALLETRDLLFARLLQYRAYKQAAAQLAVHHRAQCRRFARRVELEPRFSDVLPELLRGIGTYRLAELAAAAMMPKPSPQISADHLHIPRVSVREHAAELCSRLSRLGGGSFRSLVADCDSTLEVVARFLALLELYREGSVAFDQVVALGELQVRWTGPADPKEGPPETADVNANGMAGADGMAGVGRAERQS